MLQIKEITQKQIWEGFLMEREEKTFLDSWNWGEFQKKMGNKIWRLGIFKCLAYDVKHLIGVTLVVKIQAKRGTFLFIPHGPSLYIPLHKQQVVAWRICNLSILLKELKKIAKQENCSFIRVAPILERNEKNIKIFKDLGFRSAPIHMHPEITWELDIMPSEQELLMKMRKTTRYLIRQAQKNQDVEIIQSQDIENVEKFNELFQATVNRHHFTPFSLEYLKNEFSSFNSDNQISLFFGKYKNEIISSAMIIFWQRIGFYHQGASSLKYPKIPVSYLLQWEAIKEAKKRGCKLYNFWGIAPVSEINNHLSVINKKHPWYGLTLFKMGFGGYKKEYIKTQDLILSPKYWLNFIVEKIRKIKRGL
jgi:lipid II:glycine glycyltransferase (peptidoglycan interpeptide bridge formation enzyme)